MDRRGWSSPALPASGKTRTSIILASSMYWAFLHVEASHTEIISPSITITRRLLRDIETRGSTIVDLIQGIDANVSEDARLFRWRGSESYGNGWIWMMRGKELI
jgi:hypothetical protein